MDRRTRNLFALVLVAVIAITGGAALLLSDTSMFDPDGSSDVAAVEGVVVAVDSAGLTDVRVRVGARTPGDPFVVLLAVGTKPRRRRLRS